MKTIQSARQRVAKRGLDEKSLLKVLHSVWPKRNRVGAVNTRELLAEALSFGLETAQKYRALLLKHRKIVVRADREPLDSTNNKIFRVEYGDRAVDDMERRQRFFTLEGLTRLTFECEFGEQYEAYKARTYRSKANAL